MPRLRLRRSPAAADEQGPPTVVVMTMARDEAEMLPRWVRHYAGQVGLEHLVVFDDNSVDGSTDNLGCTVHRLPPLGAGFEGRRMRLLSGVAAGLLAVYDVAVFVDVDEFLVADPARHQDLRGFLASRREREVIAPVALNVVHVPALEGPLRADRPVLEQRSFAKFVPVMCKPSIKRIPAAWRWAAHGIEAPFEVDPELFMLHLKFADREGFRRVAAHRRALVEADGRASGSSWARETDELVAALDRSVRDVDPDRVPEFDPTEVDLRSVVEAKNGWYRSVGAGQVQALRQQPLRRVPATLVGAV